MPLAVTPQRNPIGIPAAQRTVTKILTAAIGAGLALGAGAAVAATPQPNDYIWSAGATAQPNTFLRDASGVQPADTLGWGWDGH